MGVDSQMSIAILADFQRATAVELPAAFFTNFPTPAELRKELGSQHVEDVKKSKKTAKATSRTSSRRKIRNQNAYPSAPSKQLFRLVADSLGLETGDLTPSTTFESIGIDSMMSIRIVSAFRRENRIELPAAFFSVQRTVAEAREALDRPLETEVLNTPSRSPSPMKQLHHDVAPPARMPSGSARQQKIDTTVSRAALIQGLSRSDAAPLFMTTDGSGTVESYIHLGALPRGRRIYALESPFLMCPETFDLSVEEMASIFIRTIRRIQPQGPYLIGGWSAGSIYAYEVAHRLTMQGETILALVILDMRAPSLIPTTIVTTDFVEKLGTFEGINRARDLPEDLSVMERTHLMATCRALSQYEAPAFPVGRKPSHIAVVWARLGLDIGKKLADMTLPEFERYFNSWFHGRREQFGTSGWETLLGDHISVHTVDGDHFSMMCPPFSEAVSAIVANTVIQAVEECNGSS
ncbi:putative polyketide synthase [Metarhizium brunneum]